MSDQNNREYELNINGNRFQISSNCGEEHIRKVERFLDEQISEVNRQTNAYGPTNLAFLVALNLADELLNLRGRLSRYEEVEEGCPVFVKGSKMCFQAPQTRTRMEWPYRI